MTKFLFKILPYSFFVLVFSGFSQIAQAQQQMQLLAPLPNIGSNVINFGPGCYIKRIYEFGLGIAGALAMLMIVWGAVEYAVSGAIDKKADAKDKITQAIWGLVLLLSAVLILNTVNPNLTQFQDIVPCLGGSCPTYTCP
ncbi:hypothetical protein C4553_03175 [Candidatus Parcubacteria bacterium]|nr:MAG: hypothetical protein C4553_03175 [Candidatus Parcubacteria bacterium]